MLDNWITCEKLICDQLSFPSLSFHELLVMKMYSTAILFLPLVHLSVSEEKNASASGRLAQEQSEYNHMLTMNVQY